MMILRDNLGWPMEYIKGRPITNFLRALIHTDVIVTWRRRKDGWPQAGASSADVCGCSTESPREDI